MHIQPCWDAILCYESLPARPGWTTESGNDLTGVLGGSGLVLGLVLGLGMRPFLIWIVYHYWPIWTLPFVSNSQLLLIYSIWIVTTFRFLIKGLFTRRELEGYPWRYPSKRIKVSSGLQANFTSRVTLSLGSTLPALLTCFVMRGILRNGPKFETILKFSIENTLNSRKPGKTLSSRVDRK